MLIAGSSWTTRVSQRSSATWTALVHMSCLVLSKRDHYHWLCCLRGQAREVSLQTATSFCFFDQWRKLSFMNCPMNSTLLNHFEYSTLNLPSELVRFEIVPFSKINPNDYMTISIRGVTHYSNGELDYQESGKGSSWDQVTWKFDSVSETVAFLRTPIPHAVKFT